MAPISGVARTGVFGIATRVDDPLSSTPRGRSSVVERQLPKLNVVGSIPIARSITKGSDPFPPIRGQTPFCGKGV